MEHWDSASIVWTFRCSLFSVCLAPVIPESHVLTELVFTKGHYYFDTYILPYIFSYWFPHNMHTYFFLAWYQGLDSTTRATPPVLLLLVNFSDRIFSVLLSWSWTSNPCLLSSWDCKCLPPCPDSNTYFYIHIAWWLDLELLLVC
jgi:hypothetical protein